MIKLNKPFALGEVGPHTINGTFDYSLWYLLIFINLFVFYLFRPIAIQNHFNLVAYFFAWNGPWSPITNKNAYELFNNPHVVNRDQI